VANFVAVAWVVQRQPAFLCFFDPFRNFCESANFRFLRKLKVNWTFQNIENVQISFLYRLVINKCCFLAKLNLKNVKNCDHPYAGLLQQLVAIVPKGIACKLGTRWSGGRGAKKSSRSHFSVRVGPWFVSVSSVNSAEREILFSYFFSINFR